MLAPGIRLGPYEIQELLGSGGMGEVYRARDSRLGRDVAVKVLGAGFAADADRLRRFEQEARTLAALNHPNLLAVFDFGSHDGAPYLVSELLVGETLQQRLQAGAAGPRKAVEWGRQIAAGLAAAHERGIVHRDLKPANVFLTADGRVKILDFGLARLVRIESGAEDATLASGGNTTPGMALGTVGYMAPEQVRGEAVDARADIFAFGAVLFEMLTGAKPFQRSTAADIMSAILRDEPDEPPAAAAIPPALDRIVRRCLEKQPQQRFQSASDLGFALEAALGSSASGSQLGLSAVPGAPAAAPARPGAGIWRATALLAVALLLVGGFAAWMMWPHPFDLGSLQYTPFSFESGGQGSPVWSPDGKAVAFAASSSWSSPKQIYVRYLTSETGTPLTHGDDSAHPFAWTPDSSRILFDTAKGVFSVSTTGGEPTRLLDTISGPAKGFGAVNGNGALALSPDGRDLVGMEQLPDGKFGLAVSSPPGAPPKPAAAEPFDTVGVLNPPALAFAPNGKSLLMFMHAADRGRDEAWLIPWPLTSGAPRQILNTLPKNSITPSFSWMPDSRHIVISLWAFGGLETRLWMVDTSNGRRIALSAADRPLIQPAVSPDGNRLVYADQIVNYDIVNIGLSDGRVTPLLATPRTESTPAWADKTPLLAYVSDRTGPVEIWLHSPGSPDRPLLSAGQTAGDAPGVLQINPVPSPDGARVIYGRIGASAASHRSSYQLWLAAVSGGTPERLTNNPDNFLEFGGAWSSDGNQFVLLQQRQSNAADVAIISTGGQATPTIIAKDADAYLPSWSPTGQWIAYRRLDGNWVLISPDGKQTRELGKFDSPALAFSRDGQTLYGIRPDDKPDRNQILFSLPVSGGPVHDIATLDGSEAPQALSTPGMRFTLTPDGKSLTYSTLHPSSDLWLVTGLAAAAH